MPKKSTIKTIRVKDISNFKASGPYQGEKAIEVMRLEFSNRNVKNNGTTKIEIVLPVYFIQYIADGLWDVLKEKEKEHFLQMDRFKKSLKNDPPF